MKTKIRRPSDDSSDNCLFPWTFVCASNHLSSLSNTDEVLLCLTCLYHILHTRYSLSSVDLVVCCMQWNHTYDEESEIQHHWKRFMIKNTRILQVGNIPRPHILPNLLLWFDIVHRIHTASTYRTTPNRHYKLIMWSAGCGVIWKVTLLFSRTSWMPLPEISLRLVCCFIRFPICHWQTFFTARTNIDQV